jgi:hypothetical protein
MSPTLHETHIELHSKRREIKIYMEKETKKKRCEQIGSRDTNNRTKVIKRTERQTEKKI